MDGSIAALDALVQVRERIGPDPTVLLDSGIRTGRDVAVALARCGRRPTGRPHMYGLAVGGQQGVEEVIANVLAELELTMALTGAATVSDL